MKTSIFPITVLAALLASGCVYIGSEEHSDTSWPEPVAAKDFRQFEGVYRNDSLMAKRDQGSPPSKLFDFLSGEDHSSRDSGKRVELRFSQDGTSLRIRLLGQQNRDIDAATLSRDKGFVFSGGALILNGRFSRWQSSTSNLGPSAQHELDKIRMTSTGGLRGYESDYEAGLVFDVVPTAMALRYSMFWPKLAP